MVSWVCKAQQPLNLSFEKQSVEKHRPWGWNSTSWGMSSFMLETSINKDGLYSLKAECKENCNNESYRFAVEPIDLLGKTITLEAYLKGERLTEGIDISLHYSYELNNNYKDWKEEVITSEKLSGTFTWKAVSITEKIPETTKLINIQVSFSGKGTAWFDQLELFVDNEKKNAVRVANYFTDDNIKWFKNNVVSFSTPKPSIVFKKKDSKDLNFLKKIIGKSQIVALGESTHGTSEFFTLKHKVLQYLVEEMGFRVFAIEDHQLIVRKVDEYIKTGKGNALESMSGMFVVWNRMEVLELIKWLRQYNQKHPKDMISFIGVDIQDVKPSIKSLRNFLEYQDPLLLEEISLNLSELETHAKNVFTEQDTLVKQQWVNKSKKIENIIKTHKNKWLDSAKTDDENSKILYGIQYSRLVTQYFQESLHNGQKLYRDEAMANNLLWYLKYINPEAKTLIWAHDVHISRGENPTSQLNLHSGKSMGSFLAKKLKDNYKAFGISTYSGSYRAYKTYSYQELIESPLFESPKGTIEEALHEISLKNNSPIFLPLNNARKWLKKPVPVRLANHVSFDYGFWTRYVIPDQFDGIFFIDKTSSAELIINKK